MTKIEKVNFKYKYDESYNPVYINGVHGGYTSRNMIVMNFFQERQPLPKTITYDIKDNTLNEIIDKTPASENDTVNVVRFFETGITCTLDSAIELRDWLTEQIGLAEKEEDVEDAK